MATLAARPGLPLATTVPDALNKALARSRQAISASIAKECLSPWCVKHLPSKNTRPDSKPRVHCPRRNHGAQRGAVEDGLFRLRKKSQGRHCFSTGDWFM